MRLRFVCRHGVLMRRRAIHMLIRSLNGARCDFASLPLELHAIFFTGVIEIPTSVVPVEVHGSFPFGVIEGQIDNFPSRVFPLSSTRVFPSKFLRWMVLAVMVSKVPLAA